MTANGGGPPGEEMLDLSIRGLRTRPGEQPGEMIVDLNTTRGIITAHLAPCEGRTGAVVFLPGAAGGTQGPADSMFERLSREFVPSGVTSVRVEYRHAGEFEECVLDALAACSFLKGIGATEVVLVGHSFGGAVAIKAAELAPLTNGVVSLSAQRFGTQDVDQLGKPLLLIHGDADEVLDQAASRDIFERAREPKRFEVVPGGHVLRESAEHVTELVRAFVMERVGPRD